MTGETIGSDCNALIESNFALRRRAISARRAACSSAAMRACKSNASSSFEAVGVSASLFVEG